MNLQLPKGKVLIVGAGPMASEHVKSVKKLGREFVVVGRGERSAKLLEEDNHINVIKGGIEKYSNPEKLYFSEAIICTPIETIYESIVHASKLNIKRFLIEKPGAENLDNLRKIDDFATQNHLEIFVGYNRRFYASVQKAKEMIRNNEILSMNFSFTEWMHIVKETKNSKLVKQYWGLANSSHVFDLAFYFGGYPEKLNPITKGGCSWHPAGTIFVGSGITDKGISFSYHSNWESAGRWELNLYTNDRRIIFSPLEELKIQKKGSLAIENIEISEESSIKPGILSQNKSFLESSSLEIPSLKDTIKLAEVINLIMGYK